MDKKRIYISEKISGDEENFAQKFAAKYSKKTPFKTKIGYKVFYLKDGKLYPSMVANPGGSDTPTGVWIEFP